MKEKSKRKPARSDGAHDRRLKTYFRKARGKKSARLLVKCRDCDATLEIHYDDDPLIEIGGVAASKSEWRQVLLPILNSNGRERRVKEA